MYEKSGAFSARDEQKYLRDEGHFLETYLRARRHQPAREASVQYLQDMARIRLCLDKTSDLFSGLQDDPGRRPPGLGPRGGAAGGHGTEAASRVTLRGPREPVPALGPWPLSPLPLNSAETAQDRQQYLQQVERFCTQVGNDWYRVYLVRKLTSQHGMEFVQSLSQQGHPARWVFPPDVLALQVSGSGSVLLPRSRCATAVSPSPSPTGSHTRWEKGVRLGQSCVPAPVTSVGCGHLPAAPRLDGACASPGGPSPCRAYLGVIPTKVDTGTAKG